MSNKSLVDLQNKINNLVFHKITSDEVTSWEDVHIEKFKFILDKISGNDIVFDEIKSESGWCITFDDGNISDYEDAFPALLEKDMKATFFLIASKIGQKGFVSWSNIKEMQKYGMNIGSHGLDHINFRKIDRKKIEKEFGTSKQIIEDKLGTKVTSFSYPFGEYTSSSHEMGQKTGYKYLFTSDHGLANSSDQILPRNSINSTMSINQIYKVLYPNFLQKSTWYIEDNLKNNIKKFIGREAYVKIRNLVINEK
tara:strand:+ start:2624 stop:3382 length:759 start_codon:yes stop_codon:yes gene_type:complete